MRSWYKIKKNGHGTVITKAMAQNLTQDILIHRNVAVPAWPTNNDLVIATFPCGTDPQSEEERLRERERLLRDYGILGNDLLSFLDMVDQWCSDPFSPGYEEGKVYKITCNPKLLNRTLMHFSDNAHRPEEDPDKKGINILKNKDGIFLHPPAWEYGFIEDYEGPAYKMETSLDFPGYTTGTVNTRAVIEDYNYMFAHPKKWVKLYEDPGPESIFGFDLNNKVTHNYYEELYLGRGNPVDYDDKMIFTFFTKYNPNITEGNYWPNDPTIPENKRAVNVETYPYGPFVCLNINKLDTQSPLPKEKSDIGEVRLLGILSSVQNDLYIKHLTEFGCQDFIEGDWYTKRWSEVRESVQKNMFTGGYFLSSDLSNHNVQTPCKWYDQKDNCIGAHLGDSKTFKIKKLDYNNVEYFEPQPPGHDFYNGAHAVGISAYNEGNPITDSRYELITIMPNGRVTPSISSECDVYFNVQQEIQEPLFQGGFFINVKSTFGEKWNRLSPEERESIINGLNVTLIIQGSYNKIDAYVGNNYIGSQTPNGYLEWNIPLTDIVTASGHTPSETFPANITVTFKTENNYFNWEYVGVRPVEPEDRKDEWAFE